MSKTISLSRVQEGYWRAEFLNPPVNLITLGMIKELSELVTWLEQAPDVKVIVFESGDPEFFLAHFDVLADKAETAAMQPGPTGLHPWIDVLVRLSRAPVVSIASIRGRARGAGSEFVLACDMRFASSERAVLGQFEVGVGAVPGGNPMARLAGLMGRGRSLEVVLGADDFTGDLAARYGYVNRCLPDTDLDGFVDNLARRIAGFERYALVDAKRLVDDVSLPDDAVFPRALACYFSSAAQPQTKARIQLLLAQGLQSRSDLELELGAQVGRAKRPEGLQTP